MKYEDIEERLWITLGVIGLIAFLVFIGWLLYQAEESDLDPVCLEENRKLGRTHLSRNHGGIPPFKDCRQAKLNKMKGN